MPFGYDLADDGTTLVHNPVEQQALAVIGELRSAGETLRGIAAELERRGIRSKEGKPWTHSTVQRIVNRIAA